MSLYKMRVSAKAFLFDSNDRVLLVKSKKERNGQHYWCTPGGGIEEGESLHAAAEREVLEETGYTGRVQKIVFAQDISWENSGRNLEIFMVGGLDELQPPKDSHDHEFQFFSEEEFAGLYFLPNSINPFELRKKDGAEYYTYL